MEKTDTKEVRAANPKPFGTRDVRIDFIRGLALMGVVLMNLLTQFRVPFLMYIEKFHTDPGIVDHAVDWITGIAIDRKSFGILTLLFGFGVAAMAERTNGGFKSILGRRFLFLLVCGVLHALFVFSGDILIVYSVIGFCLISLVNRSTPLLWAIIVICGVVRLLAPWPQVPLGNTWGIAQTESLQAYSAGTYAEVVAFRYREYTQVIGPLELTILPRTLAFAIAGVLCWRNQTRVLQSAPLWLAVCVGLPIGALFTTLETLAIVMHWDWGHWTGLVGDLGVCSLSIAYCAAMMRIPATSFLVRCFAPLGRLSITAYVTQTVVLGLIFYGYGLGYYFKLTSFEAMLVGLTLYGVQVAGATIYLRRFQQGPIEWIWRKFIYLA